MSKKLICGVATNSGGKYKSRTDGKVTKSYRTWQNMLRRAYCPKYHAVKPTYADCAVSEEWLEYQEFAKWFEAHEYSNHGYELDKDLSLPDNKIYAPDRCVFVPRQLNSLLLDCGAARGDLPQGLTFRKEMNKYHVRLSVNGIRKHLGYFDTEPEAYQVYRIAKEANVKRMANHWQDRIADNVFEALMNWQLTE